MKIIKNLVLFATPLVMANVAGAAELSPYVAARLAYVDVNNKANEWITTTGEFSSIANKRLTDQNLAYRFAAGLEIPLPYQFSKAFRTEVEYGLLNKTHNAGGWTLNFPGGTSVPASYKLQTKLETVFVNFYYDFDTCTNFSPYLTAGIGWAHIDENASVAEPFGIEAAEGKEDNLAWNIGAGIGYSVAENLNLDVGYRYTNYGTVRHRAEGGITKRDYYSHEVSLGLRFNF